MLVNSYESLDYSSCRVGGLAGQSANAIKEHARETRSARKEQGKNKTLVNIRYLILLVLLVSHFAFYRAINRVSCSPSRSVLPLSRVTRLSFHWRATGNQAYWVVIFYLYFPNNLESNACVWCCVFARFSLELLRYTIGLKNSRHFFIQSQVKAKPIVTLSHTFSRAFRHSFRKLINWFSRLSMSFVTAGQND